MDRSIRNPEVFVKTNVLGTLVMLNAAKVAWELPDGSFKEGKKFLHVSTDEVYGSLEHEGEYFYETTPYDPHSPYSASKGIFRYAGEILYGYVQIPREYHELQH